MKLRCLPLILVSFLHTSLCAQDLVLGGLQGTEPLWLTPSVGENAQNKSKPLHTIPYFGFSEIEDEKYLYQFTPVLPKDWNWLAVFNLPLKGKKLNFFYYEAWVASSHRGRTNGRLRTLENDITAKVKSNCYHIALHRAFAVENECFMLLVSPKKQKVIVELPAEVFKVNRRLEYEMEAMEAKFVHIIVPPAEYTVVTWKEEKGLRPYQVLSDGWRFNFGDVKGAENPAFADKNWEKVTVPHTWNAEDLFDYRNYKDTLDIRPLYRRGIGWYRNTFTVPKSWQGRYVRINFLGANQVAEVWLNGKYLGKHIGGYIDFHFGLKDDELFFDKPNILAVKVDNRSDFDIPPHTADYNFVGGIYREVQVMCWNPYLVRDIRVVTPKVSPTQADLEVTTNFNNKSTQAHRAKLMTNVVNPMNEIIASQALDITLPSEQKPSFTQKFQVENPQLWSPDNPAIYRIVSTLYDDKGKVVDQKIENFGIRFFEFTTDKGLLLNGQRIKMKGVNVHQDYMHRSWAVDSTQKRSDFILIKQMGANYVRFSHYPHHPYSLYLCDSLGLMVWAEIPVVNTVGKEAFIKNAVKMMEKMIYRDKNHPSILLWGVGNEYYREFFDKETAEWALRCTEAVAKKCKELDPYRPTIQAQNDLIDDKIMPLTDIQGRNRYFGWYTGADVYGGVQNFDGFAKMMDKEHAEKPQWKILVSEYGAEAKIGYHVNQPRRFDHSETYQIQFHKAYWEYIKATDWVIGGTIWNMFDFASWAKIGNIPHLNQKGTMTYDRKPKSLYYYYQSQWTEKPMVYIYSHTQTHRTGEKGKKQALEVFSNCTEVELFLNGATLGRRKKADKFNWEADLAEGYQEIKAVGYHEGETVRDKRQFYFSFETDKKKLIEGKDSD